MSAKDRIEAAMDRFAAGDLDGAIEAAKRAIEEDPANADACEMLGEFCKHAGRLDEAIEYATKLVEVDPANTMGYVNLSRYYMLKGDKETAEYWQEKARGLTPKAGPKTG